MLARLLGPGLVTGAADDDPSGIATYSQAGAQFGNGLLWTVILTWPFMVAIQLVSARIGRVTGQGIVANVNAYFPRPVVVGLVGLLVAANTINIAADLAAMGDALELMIGGPGAAYALVMGIVCVLLEVFVPYHRYAPIMKWLTLVLFAYVATMLTIPIDWLGVLRATVWPTFSLRADYLLVVVAVFGTTISPYLFFWQASQEVEEIAQHKRRRPLREAGRGGTRELRRIGLDTAVGMAFSNIIAFFIILTAAATLNAHGVTNIQTSAQAAEALRPLAGNLAFTLFALGIVGTGMLAVPVLAGSAGYGIAEAFGWKASLEAAPRDARKFYEVIAIATIIGVVMALSPIDPIQMLFWSAVVNGVVAVPIMAVMMLIASNRKIMGHFVIHRAMTVMGWGATGLMALVVAVLAWASWT